MKRFFKLIATIAGVIAIASCNEVEYTTCPYVTFDTTSASVNEDCGEITLKVVSHNLSNTATVSFKINNGTAVEGKNIDFKTSPVVTFNGNEAKEIVLSVTNLAGIFTGSLNCSVGVASVTEGMTVGSYGSAAITIKDLDHPLSAFIGDWSGSFISYYDDIAYAWEFSISPVDGDLDALTITNFDPAGFGGKFNVKVNDTKDGFVIADNTQTGMAYSSYGAIMLRGVNAPKFADATAYSDITLTLVDGKLELNNAVISKVSAGNLEIADGPVVFTK